MRRPCKSRQGHNNLLQLATAAMQLAIAATLRICMCVTGKNITATLATSELQHRGHRYSHVFASERRADFWCYQYSPYCWFCCSQGQQRRQVQQLRVQEVFGGVTSKLDCKECQLLMWCQRELFCQGMSRPLHVTASRSR
jgi:hypothetical protein